MQGCQRKSLCVKRSLPHPSNPFCTYLRNRQTSQRSKGVQKFPGLILHKRSCMKEENNIFHKLQNARRWKRMFLFRLLKNFSLFQTRVTDFSLKIPSWTNDLLPSALREKSKPKLDRILKKEKESMEKKLQGSDKKWGRRQIFKVGQKYLSFPT